MVKTMRIFQLSLLVIFLSSCSNDSESMLSNQLLQLKQQVEQYRNENVELKAEVEKLNNLVSEKQGIIDEKPIKMRRATGISYIALLDEEQLRYIDNQIDVKALPFEDAPSINNIRDNTVVKVYDKVSNTGNYDDTETIWYYVSVPVHDSPTDCKGWVKYKETSKYDDEKKKTLKSEIGIRIGAKYSEASTLPNFKSDKSLWTCDYNIMGRIEKRQEGYVLLECSGGKMCWVNEKDLVYPEVP